jgi:uncharacterized small protein (DUF1192 family)
MIDDDDAPKSLAGVLSQAEMAAMSIDELEERIISLEAEIERLRLDIINKKAASASADDFFKK